MLWPGPLHIFYENFMDNLLYFKDNILPILTPIGALIASGSAAYTYRRNSKLRRAEWLYSLFEKFFCEDKYADIRQIIDYAKTAELNKLKQALSTHDNTLLEEKLVNYLNFFEFIANLWLLKQVPFNEIKMMFDYYIRRLGDHDFIVDYIKSNGFEGLVKLMAEIKSDSKHVG